MNVLKSYSACLTLALLAGCAPTRPPAPCIVRLSPLPVDVAGKFVEECQRQLSDCRSARAMCEAAAVER